jgi:tetratricopeptide (TPR) repeat protein
MVDPSLDPRSEDYVNAAEVILGRYLKPGQWATEATASRFLRRRELERVLTLYEDAMATDPREPAYPWNLASGLDRLGLHDLALAYVQRALRVATEAGDEEWADAHAHLAWADIALNAGQRELALIAIERARSLDPDLPVERYIRRARQQAVPKEG